MLFRSPSSASPPPGSPTTPTEPETLAANAGLDAIVPAEIWKDCQLQTVAEPSALQTAVCLPADGVPDRWEISSYPNGVALDRAYDKEIDRHKTVSRDKGECSALSWGGEHEWVHGPGKPGGRYFCYFDGNDAVIVWTHHRFDQPSHRDILIIAREGGSDHAGLADWWSPWHHRIGKAN